VTDIGRRLDRVHTRGPGGIDGERSVNIGCVALTERHLHGNPPAGGRSGRHRDIEAALDHVADAMTCRRRGPGGLPARSPRSPRSALGLAVYDSARIHHSRISAPRCTGYPAELLAMDPRGARRHSGHATPAGGRDRCGARSYSTGSWARFGFAEFWSSEHDILDGIAWSMVA